MNPPMMSIDDGEELASALVGGHIPGTGRYKFLAKKKINGSFEWTHFIERDSGMKESVFIGHVKNQEELDLVVEIMNRNLKRIFGDKAEMVPGFPQIFGLDGMPLQVGMDKTVN